MGDARDEYPMAHMCPWAASAGAARDAAIQARAWMCAEQLQGAMDALASTNEDNKLDYHDRTDGRAQLSLALRRLNLQATEQEVRCHRAAALLDCRSRCLLVSPGPHVFGPLLVCWCVCVFVCVRTCARVCCVCCMCVRVWCSRLCTVRRDAILPRAGRASA